MPVQSLQSELAALEARIARLSHVERAMIDMYVEREDLHRQLTDIARRERNWVADVIVDAKVMVECRATRSKRSGMIRSLTLVIETINDQQKRLTDDDMLLALELKRYEIAATQAMAALYQD